MFIPAWILWTIGIFIWLAASSGLFFRQRGDYDFASPLYGMIIFFAGLAFIIGKLL